MTVIAELQTTVEQQNCYDSDLRYLFLLLPPPLPEDFIRVSNHNSYQKFINLRNVDNHVREYTS